MTESVTTTTTIPMTEQEAADYYPKCDACGAPWVGHLGASGLCAELQELRQRIADEAEAAHASGALLAEQNLRRLLKNKSVQAVSEHVAEGAE